MTTTGIRAVDYHAGGEPFRIVTDVPEIAGATVADRRLTAISDPEIDWLRALRGVTEVVIDVPSGRVRARVAGDGERVHSVDFVSVPSYVLHDQVTVPTSRGEIQCAISFGGAIKGFSTRPLVITEDDLTELGAALTNGLPERSGRTVFKTVGVAMEDWAITALLARRLLATVG
jgi:proline racemase